jgi:hypothetical protein
MPKEKANSGVEKRKASAPKKIQDQMEDSWTPAPAPTLSADLREHLDAFSAAAKRHGVAEGDGNAVYAASAERAFNQARAALEFKILTLEMTIGRASIDQAVDHTRFTQDLDWRVHATARQDLCNAWGSFGCTNEGLKRVVNEYDDFVAKWLDERLAENSASTALGQPMKPIFGIDAYDNESNNGRDFLSALEEMVNGLRPLRETPSPGA